MVKFIIMLDQLDTVLTDRKGKPPIILTTEYNPPNYDFSHISIKQELLGKTSNYSGRPRASTIHQPISGNQSSRHKIRVGRGRLP
jgi:hypothetical protein